MKKHLLLFSILISIIAVSNLSAQGICNPSGNILVYSNYDGGTFTINIDENIPNIRIGLCSYEDLHVTISGTYAGNVVEVLYAGYNSGGTTSVSGVDAGIVSILNYPPVTLFDADGYGYMICAYECDTDYVPGGCNTVDQAVDYFATNLDGMFRYSEYQYGVFTGTWNMSDGGNCCLGADESCTIAIDAGQNAEICAGDSIQLSGSGATNYTWFPVTGLSDGDVYNPYASPDITTTYILTGTDAEGCVGIDTVTITVNPYPVVTVTDMGDGNLIATGGGTYQWYFNGDPIPGAINETLVAETTGYYYVVVTSAAGCTVTTEEMIVVVQGVENNYYDRFVTCYPNPVNDELNIAISNNLQVETITLYSVNGQQMQTITNVNSNIITLQTSAIASGIYTVKLLTNYGIVVKQIVIE